MKLVNTYLNNDCTKKCQVYVDLNGYYHLKKYQIETYAVGVSEIGGYEEKKQGRTKFKKIESLNRAVKKWVV